MVIATAFGPRNDEGRDQSVMVIATAFGLAMTQDEISPSLRTQ